MTVFYSFIYFFAKKWKSQQSPLLPHCIITNLLFTENIFCMRVLLKHHIPSLRDHGVAFYVLAAEYLGGVPVGVNVR